MMFVCVLLFVVALIAVACCLLLFVVVCCCLFLYVVVCCWLLFGGVCGCLVSVAVVRRCSLLVVCRRLSVVGLWLAVACHRLLVLAFA